METIVESTINLADYQTKNVFTGRLKGEDVRVRSKVDELEANSQLITVIIPETIFSINPSFLEELFKNVVKKLGRDKFLHKFNFISNGRYKIKMDINEAIERILEDN